MNISKISFLLLVVLTLHHAECSLSVSSYDILITLHKKSYVELQVEDFNYSDVALEFIVEYKDIVRVSPSIVLLTEEPSKLNITIEGLKAGQTEIYTNISKPNIYVDKIIIRASVLRSRGLEVLSLLIGWLYFLAWSLSFYPQIFTNWIRKSVVGLSFDFLALNIVGFMLYCIFNLWMYFSIDMQHEYSERFPREENPVLINDIFFAIHGVIAAPIIIIQCFIYESSNQTVSLPTKLILGAFGTFLGINAFFACGHIIHWFDFIYLCSYVKLCISLIKYSPQVYLNHARESTEGWSIGNVLLDFVGGVLSMLQMILNSYNFNDWESIFGDPTKFGLGIVSVSFAIIFMIQHYILYNHHDQSKIN